MNVHRSIVAALFPAPSFLGSGHICVSCPHPILPCQHSSPLPQSDCPNTASSSNAETGGKPESTSALLDDPADQIQKPSVESSIPNAHDPVAHSIPQPHILQIHKSPGYPLPLPPLWLPSISEIGTLEPRLHDTDSAISWVITYEICSLLPPCASMLRTQLVCKDSRGPALSAIPIRDRLRLTPPKGWGFLCTSTHPWVCRIIYGKTKCLYHPCFLLLISISLLMQVVPFYPGLNKITLILGAQNRRHEVPILWIP